MNSKVDAYISNARKWGKELEKLRMIMLDCGLTEELKWGAPCYSYPTGSSRRPRGKGQKQPQKNTNILIMGELKDCCLLSFFKGALLQDAVGVLAKPGEHTRTARVIRFTNVHEIAKMAPLLKSYIYEAIEVELAGLKPVNPDTDKKNTGEPIPEEFFKTLHKNPALKTAFEALTPGRQRAYLLYFSAPKQSRTRVSRIEKYVQQILDGIGLNDHYKAARK